jgi:flagellar operon protein
MANKVHLIPGIVRQPASLPAPSPAPPKGRDFAATLAREAERQQSLRISSHAQKRLNSSQVKLTESDLERIDGAVVRATEKGSNQSLIMLDNLALVVSIKNKVVITAVDEARTTEGIFTNIDSVVIA